MIRFGGVYKRYPSGQEALSGLSFHMEAGSMAFLTGHSGAGKSTLLKLIAGVEQPSSGQVLIDGKNIVQLSKSQMPIYRRKIGLVFQDYQLLHDRTVFDNVALPLIIAGADHQEIGRRVRAALDKVGLLEKERNLPVALSGGEQQRVGIARAVVNRPMILLADEPTGNLDAQLSSEIMQLFKQFNQIGTTVLIATHDLNLVQQMGYAEIALKQGRVDAGKMA
jgi:cell division transport system ATP-binding protein